MASHISTFHSKSFGIQYIHSSSFYLTLLYISCIHQRFLNFAGLSPKAEDVYRPLKRDLYDIGLDVVDPLCVDWYNNCLPQNAISSRIPLCPSAKSNALVVLVGNSKHLWPKFLHACAQKESHLVEDAHPLEKYLEQSVGEIVADLVQVTNTTIRVYWSHSMAELEGGVAYVAFQRMAQAAGIAWLDETSHLSYHSVYGPWLSLRCCLVFDDIPAFDSVDNSKSASLLTPPPRELTNPLSEDAQKNVQLAAKKAISAAHSKREGNNSGDDDFQLQIQDVNESWKYWLAIRDAADSGNPHPFRYCGDQILYHYTRNRDHLRRVVQKYADQLNVS